MKVYSLQKRDGSGAGILVQEGFAKKGFGFGEEPAKEGREVTLTGREIMEAVSGLDGFCTKKFAADILTENVDYLSLKKGDRLCLGEAVIEIASTGKKCFPDCPVEDKPCLLNANCAFANVVTEGPVKAGDEIKLL